MDRLSSREHSSQIENLYRQTLTAYGKYLDDDMGMGPIEAKNTHISGFDALLFFVMTHKVARELGVSNKITICADEYTGENEMAVVTYDTDTEQAAYARFIHHTVDPRYHPLYGQLIESDPEPSLACLTAVRAGVPMDDVIASFPHLGNRHRERLQMAYENRADWLTHELSSRLILMQSLRHCAYPSTISQSIIDLASIGKDQKPDSPLSTKQDEVITGQMSQQVWDHMLQDTVKSLIHDGVTPLSPEEYYQLVRKVMLE